MEDLLAADLTETQRMIRDTVREVATKEFLPRAAKLDETGEFPRENFKRLAEMGLVGIPVPEEFADRFVTNIAFGGADLRTAYLTLSTTGRLIACDWPTAGTPLAFTR